HIILLPNSNGLLPVGVSDPNNYLAPSCGTTGCVSSIGGTTVNLNAGYIRLAGPGAGSTAITVPKLADGSLRVSAQWIDLEGADFLDNVANAVFTSTGPIRLLSDDYGNVRTVQPSGAAYVGALVVPGNLTLQAAEIYPVSGTEFLLASTGSLASYSTLTILP